MQIHFHEKNGTRIAEIESDEMLIASIQDAVDLMADCSYQGAHQMILKDHHLHPGFFDLKTKLAGDILQKFSNYRMKLAIVGDFSGYSSNSLRNFIFESNKLGNIVFADRVDAVLNSGK
jgi:hypothetical protein